MRRALRFLFLFTGLAVWPYLQAQTVPDIDGNIYTTVAIGGQTWLAENLKTSRFSNGDSIPTVSGATANDTSSVFQWAYNDDTTYVELFGRLYTWYAAIDPRNVCPAGWHVPSQAEWQELSNLLGGSPVAGNSLKDTGTAHWLVTDNGVNNSSGFSARGSGFRGNPQGFKQLREVTCFWSTTPFGISGFARGFKYSLFADTSLFDEGVAVGNFGACIRCVKNRDVGVQTGEPEERLRLYPNPSKGLLQIQLPFETTFDLSVYSMSGRLVYSETAFTTDCHELQLNKAPPGICHIVIRSKAVFWSGKWVLIE